MVKYKNDKVMREKVEKVLVFGELELVSSNTRVHGVKGNLFAMRSLIDVRLFFPALKKIILN